MGKNALLLLICCVAMIAVDGCTGTTAKSAGAGVNASGMEASPAALTFGNVAVGSTSAQSIALTNMAGSSVTLSAPISSTTAFSASGPTFPMSLQAGQTVALKVAFAPTAMGAANGTITVASDSGNSTMISVAGSGTAAGLIPASSNLDFGSVGVGSSNSLPVVLTNGSSSSITISGVSATGPGFNASGISNGQTIAAGQTATLNVTFAPAATGNASGSVILLSNAANSPTGITLAGSGTAAQASAATAPPICGKSGDTTNYVPTDWSTFVPPAKGQSYVDPTFGCTVTRITDSSSEDWEQYCATGGGCFLPIGHGYATVSPFNANDTYLMLADGVGEHFVTDLKGNTVVPIASMPNCGNSSSCTTANGANDTWFYWDATNPAVFYYTYSNYMMKGVINGSSATVSVVHQFTEYAGINFMDKTDISQDGAHVIIVGGDNTGSSPENLFDYNFVANTKGPVYTTGCTAPVNSPNNACVHGVSQTPDNNVMIGFAYDGTGSEQGGRLWTGSYPMAHIQDGTNHLDAGYDMNGSSVIVEMGNPGTLSTDVNPCPSGWGLDVRQIYDMGSAVCLLDGQPSWHVGYRGNPNQPWAGISFFDTRTGSPEWFDSSSNYSVPSSANWQLYEDEIMVVRIDANNNPKYAYRLARAYSRSDEDFYATPRAAISRDGRYIAFGSNMAYAHTGCPANYQSQTGCTDVYVIKIH